MKPKPLNTDHAHSGAVRYGRIFDGITILIYAALVWEMWRIWNVPTIEDFPRLQTLALLMGFEFILVHSALFMAVAPRNLAIVFLLLVYGIMALMLNTGAENNIILYLYLGVMFTRLRFMFTQSTVEQRAHHLKISIIAGFIYVFSIAVIAIGEQSLPSKGLTESFLTREGYFDTLEVFGIFTEQPHLPLIMGMVYFSLLITLNLVLMFKTVVKDRNMS